MPDDDLARFRKGEPIRETYSFLTEITPPLLILLGPLQFVHWAASKGVNWAQEKGRVDNQKIAAQEAEQQVRDLINNQVAKNKFEIDERRKNGPSVSKNAAAPKVTLAKTNASTQVVRTVIDSSPKAKQAFTAEKAAAKLLKWASQSDWYDGPGPKRNGEGLTNMDRIVHVMNDENLRADFTQGVEDTTQHFDAVALAEAKAAVMTVGDTYRAIADVGSDVPDRIVDVKPWADFEAGVGAITADLDLALPAIGISSLN